MKTRLVKKRRLARARAHQAKTRTLKPYSPWADPKHDIAADLRAARAAIASDSEVSDAVQTEVEPPARALCPSCSTRQKVRKDGTIGGHNVYLSSNPLDPVECQGVGARWDAS